MAIIDDLLAANQASLPTHQHRPDPRPVRRLVVLTCMDARIDVFAVEDGVQVFERLEKELVTCLEQKGYRSVEECRGKLKEL